MPFVRFGRPGLLGTVARTAVIAGTATVTANAIGRHAQRNAAEQWAAAQYQAEQQAEAQAAAAQQAVAPYAASSPPTAPPAGGTDIVSQLSELARLRNSGALTAQDFAAAKAKLLRP
jgi:hypothetical protein